MTITITITITNDSYNDIDNNYNDELMIIMNIAGVITGDTYEYS